MTTYPHTIDNGNGERLTFVRHGQDQRGDYLEIENRIQPNAGPPMHTHHLQEEGMTVVSGRMAFQIEGQEPQYVTAGESFVFEPGVPHCFWNAGDDELHVSGYVRPAYNLEYFLSAIYDSVRENGGHRPDPFEAAYLLTCYKSEFSLLEIPGFVQKFIFPVQVWLGKAIGKYDKYKDGPQPVIG